MFGYLKNKYELRGEENADTDWNLWSTFANFKERDMNWYHNDIIDNLKF